MESWVIWVIAALLAFLIEIFTLGFAVMCFAIGALAAAIVAYCDGGLSWQILLFSIFSIFSLVVLRPLAIRVFSASRSKTNTSALVGRVAVVTDEIRGGEGRADIDGDNWRVVMNDEDEVVAVGEKVVVVEINSVVLTVKKR